MTKRYVVVDSSDITKQVADSSTDPFELGPEYSSVAPTTPPGTSRLSKFLNSFLVEDALIVTVTNWPLHDATTTGSPLTIGTVPTGSFRTKVTLSSVTSHTDCAGTITIGAETLTFVQAGTKTSSTILTSKPAVTQANLDCHILITAIDTSGSDIKSESTIAISVRWEDYTKLWQSPGGQFAQSDARIFTNSVSPVVDSIIKYDRNNPTDPTNGINYTVTQMRSRYDKQGTFIFKTLYI